MSNQGDVINSGTFNRDSVNIIDVYDSDSDSVNKKKAARLDYGLKKNFPITPKEFIDMEPCLDDLRQFVEEYAELLKERDDLKVGLEGYISISKERWANGTYWLLGVLTLLPSQRLSNTILGKSVDIYEKRFNQHKQISMETWFKSIKNLIAMYYNVKIEEYYAQVVKDI